MSVGISRFKSEFHENKDWNTKRDYENLLSMPGSRASSTKTRIETIKVGRNWGGPMMFKSEFHENKDWNDEEDDAKMSDMDVQERVPRKQGLKLLY